MFDPNLKRTEEEKIAALAEQMEMLKASSENYDRGNCWEAKRLATTVATLLLDGRGKIRPLLVQLGLRSTLQFISTARSLETMRPRLALVAILLDGGPVRYSPYCDTEDFKLPWTHEMKFQEWWEEPVFGAADGRTLSRKNVVFSLRSQDGGAHFDENWGNDLSKMIATTNDEQLTTGDGKPIANAHLGTMRQIAWELTETLKPVLGNQKLFLEAREQLRTKPSRDPHP
ncbi:hypothetical protein [Bradyrhizobium sp. CCGE-LA001]|uniref:hypothetical protein n=1 Tax=Bradyrhizobium sp. CCGE-LA001 TaxID=1223566 RepID=UPI0002AABF5A|nr:hypothetical protein [Bradyrhizobium sp. CCGE-LA001]AMA58064.1 hypothetical protein BCCGELA001_18450 [Bradyrhizobium sp. CCGE-LA001]